MDRNSANAASALALVGIALVICLFGAAAPVSQAATTGLVAAYSFDEGTGSVVTDSSGNGNNGTLQNTAWSGAGKYGGALSFNGTSSMVVVPDAASLDLSSGMTLEAWIDPALVSGWRNILFKQQTGGMVYSLYASEGNGYSDGQVNIGGEKNAVDPWITPTNGWNFLAVTYDGSNLRLYGNAVLVQTLAVSGLIPSSGGPLTIGGDSVWGEFFQGLIDNVRVYNRALTASEIQTDMNTAVTAASPVAPPPPPPPPSPTSSTGPVAAYAFDEGSGTTVADASGNGNTGTVQNGTWSSTGEYGGALSFNGTSTMVSIPDAPKLDLTSGATLEAWIDPSTVNTPDTILFKQQSGGLVYGMYGSDGTGYSNGKFSIGGTQSIVDPWQTPTNQWNFLAITYDGSNLKLYGNAVLVKTVPMTGTILTSTGKLTIGGNSVWGEWFQGLIDNVRVYNRALSGAEIQTDMNTPVPGSAASPPPPPSGDTQAPTTPANLAITGATQSSVSVSWSASSDNVGVAGYGTYKNGASAGSTSATTYTYAGLACGTTYTLSVDAYDAAGNRSAKTSINAATSACPTSTATVFVAPGGSDANPCTQAAPCASFDRAYHVAQPGQTVQVAGGSYPFQTVNADASKTSTTDVIFRPAAGASVTLGGIDVYGSHMSFQDMTINGDWQTYQNTDDVTFRNLTVNGGFFTQSSSNISVIGGSVGGMVNTKPQVGVWPAGTENRNILIDGVYFHDMTRTDPSVHTECMLIGGANGVTVRNSRFHNCDVFDLSIGAMNGTQSQNITIENNFFEAANGYYSLYLNDEPSSMTNLLVRNNSSDQEMYFSYGSPTLSNVRVVGNVSPMSQWACNGAIAYSHNVWQGATCGSSDINAPAGFKNAAAGDFHLAAGSAAINRGDPGNYPSTDIDGQARPMGGAPDAGADEAG